MDKRDKLKELVVYIFYGVLSTLVDMGTYQGLEWLFRPRWGDHSYLFSTLVAFVVATVFAFIVNKLFVFKQKSWEHRQVLHEVWTFFAARLFSFLIGVLFTVVVFDLIWPHCEAWFTPLWLRVPYVTEILDSKDAFRLLSKFTLIGILVVILNYFFSKWVVFKKKKPEEPQA